LTSHLTIETPLGDAEANRHGDMVKVAPEPLPMEESADGGEEPEAEASTDGSAE